VLDFVENAHVFGRRLGGMKELSAAMM